MLLIETNRVEDDNRLNRLFHINIQLDYEKSEFHKYGIMHHYDSYEQSLYYNYDYLIICHLNIV